MKIWRRDDSRSLPVGFDCGGFSHSGKCGLRVRADGRCGEFIRSEISVFSVCCSPLDCFFGFNWALDIKYMVRAVKGCLGLNFSNFMGLLFYQPCPFHRRTVLSSQVNTNFITS